MTRYYTQFVAFVGHHGCVLLVIKFALLLFLLVSAIYCLADGTPQWLGPGARDDRFLSAAILLFIVFAAIRIGWGGKRASRENSKK